MTKNIILMIITLISSLTSHAQNGIPTQDLKEIQSEFTSTSSKIETELKKDSVLYNKMKVDLDLLSALKDSSARNKAISNYQTNYIVAYGKVVAKAGVDMNSVIANLNSKFPSYTFSINNSYSIEIKKKALKTKSFKKGSPAGTTTTEPIKSFQRIQDVNCGLVGFGEVTFGTKSVRAATTGVVAGGCIASGDLKNTTTLSSAAKKIILKLNMRSEASGYAVGILGTSSTSETGVADIEIIANPEFYVSVYSSIDLFAPVAWVANRTTSEDFSEEIDVTEFKGKSMSIHLSSNSYSISALCCATNGFAKSTINTAELIITK